MAAQSKPGSLSANPNPQRFNANNFNGFTYETFHHLPKIKISRITFYVLSYPLRLIKNRVAQLIKGEGVENMMSIIV